MIVQYSTKCLAGVLLIPKQDYTTVDELFYDIQQEMTDVSCISCSLGSEKHDNSAVVIKLVSAINFVF